MKKNVRVRRVGNVRRATEALASLRVETVEDSWSVVGATNYHLGAVIIHACQSAEGSKKITSAAVDQNSGAIHVDVPGDEYPRPYDWAQEWHWNLINDGLLHGRLQYTYRF